MKRLATALALVMTLVFGVQAARAETLASVKERGELICGANGTLAGLHFVVLGQMRPTTSQTLFELDLVGQVVSAAEVPVVPAGVVVVVEAAVGEEKSEVIDARTSATVTGVRCWA